MRKSLHRILLSAIQWGVVGCGRRAWPVSWPRRDPGRGAPFAAMCAPRPAVRSPHGRNENRSTTALGSTLALLVACSTHGAVGRRLQQLPQRHAALRGQRLDGLGRSFPRGGHRHQRPGVLGAPLDRGLRHRGRDPPVQRVRLGRLDLHRVPVHPRHARSRSPTSSSTTSTTTAGRTTGRSRCTWTRARAW